MKIKIGNRIYDGNKEPIMVILSDRDKKNISDMDPNHMRYCVYPTKGWNRLHVLQWMEEDKKPKEKI